MPNRNPKKKFLGGPSNIEKFKNAEESKPVLEQDINRNQIITQNKICMTNLSTNKIGLL